MPRLGGPSGAAEVCAAERMAEPGRRDPPTPLRTKNGVSQPRPRGPPTRRPAAERTRKQQQRETETKRDRRKFAVTESCNRTAISLVRSLLRLCEPDFEIPYHPFVALGVSSSELHHSRLPRKRTRHVERTPALSLQECSQARTPQRCKLLRYHTQVWYGTQYYGRRQQTLGIG